MMRTAIVVLAAALFATGCGTQDVARRTPAPMPETAPIPEPAPTGDADWSSAEVVTLVLEEYAFVPKELVFEKGRRYRLRLSNAGSKTHTFDSPAFFRAIAMRSVAADAPAGEASQTTTIELRPGEERELAFVPLEAGTYALECDVFLHDVFGMTGRIVVR